MSVAPALWSLVCLPSSMLAFPLSFFALSRSPDRTAHTHRHEPAHVFDTFARIDPQMTVVRRRAMAMLAFVLPRGYPESVHFPYGTYAAWHFSGMVAAAAAGVMSTQALVSECVGCVRRVRRPRVPFFAV